MAPVRQSNSILGWLGWRLGFPQAYRWHHRITSLIKSAWLHGYISMSVSFNLEDSCLQWAAYEYLTGMCSAKSKTEYLQTQTHVKVIFPNKQQKPTTSSYPPPPPVHSAHVFEDPAKNTPFACHESSKRWWCDPLTSHPSHFHRPPPFETSIRDFHREIPMEPK